MADSTGPAPALVPAGTAPDDATLTASGPRKNKGGRPRDEALYAQFHDVPSDGYHTHPQTACGHCGRQSIKLVDRMRAHLAKCGAYLAAAPELARTGARLPSLVPQRRRRNGEVAADKAAMREARAAAAADAVAGVRTLHQHVDPALVTPRTQRTALAAAAMAPSSAPPKARPSTNAGDAAGGLYTTFAADPRVAPRRRQTLPSLPASERERIDRQIVRTMAVNGWPLSIFDDEQGRMLLATLNSAYTPPDKATVERLTDELFEEMRVKVADVASLSVRDLVPLCAWRLACMFVHLFCAGLARHGPLAHRLRTSFTSH